MIEITEIWPFIEENIKYSVESSKRGYLKVSKAMLLSALNMSHITVYQAETIQLLIGRNDKLNLQSNRRIL